MSGLLTFSLQVLFLLVHCVQDETLGDVIQTLLDLSDLEILLECLNPQPGQRFPQQIIQQLDGGGREGVGKRVLLGRVIDLQKPFVLYLGEM